MPRYNIPAGPYTLRGVDDWLCYLTDADGNWFSYWTECDPLWSTFPARLARFAMGLGRGTGNADTWKNRRDAAECIAAIGIRKALLGHKPDAITEPDSIAGLVDSFA